MHKTFKNQGRYNLDKIPIKLRWHTKECQNQICPNYIKEANQHMIDNKSNQHINDYYSNQHMIDHKVQQVN